MVAQEGDLLVEQHLQVRVVLVSLQRLDEERERVSRQHVQRNDAHLWIVQPLSAHEGEVVKVSLPRLEIIGHLAKVLAFCRAVDGGVRLNASCNRLGRQWYSDAAPYIKPIRLLGSNELVAPVAGDVHVEKSPQLTAGTHGLKPISSMYVLAIPKFWMSGNVITCFWNDSAQSSN